MMEETAAAAADDEYMTMDAEQWSGLDDIYENDGTLGHDLRGKAGSNRREAGPDPRGQKLKEMKKETFASKRQLQIIPNPTPARPSIPPTDRYITIRRPPKNENREKRISEIDFLRLTTVCLLLLCILLLGGLLGLNFHYARTFQDNVTQVVTKELVIGLLGNLRDISRKFNLISSTNDSVCFSVSDLFALRCDGLEVQLRQRVPLSNITPSSLNCNLLPNLHNHNHTAGNGLG